MTDEAESLDWLVEDYKGAGEEVLLSQIKAFFAMARDTQAELAQTQVELIEAKRRLEQYERAGQHKRLGNRLQRSAMLDTLIRLCHPDKHNDSEAAKEVTQWLLEVRRWQQ